MVTLEFLYHEIMDEDYTAVDARIIENGQIIAHFRNYDTDHFAQEIYGNQSERFNLPDTVSAIHFIESAGSYHQIHF